MDQKEAREKVARLVERYDKLTPAQIKEYKEEDTKKGFIEPLFEALGWDIRDREEVSTEETIVSAGRVDYSFKINGRVKFYLEAKPLRADLNTEKYAKQAIRYAWNKDVDWAVLTDFETVKIFYSQDIDASLWHNLYFEIPHSELVERFDELWVLSKESFEKDLIDEEARKRGKKLQKVSVTNLLYKDLNKARELLTDGLNQCNPGLDDELLDEGVQKLLDRIIFLKVAEDRGLEPSTLMPLIRQHQTSSKLGQSPYESMIEKFRELDKTYNSDLFTEHPFEKWDEFSGKTEKAIRLFEGEKGYYEYDFSVIPADVLGGVYEHYLGYQLAKSQKGATLSKDAKKRKEQGIYYTPTYIVDYIVNNALKPVLDKCKSVHDLKQVKVLDPACGSGSFLLKALEVIWEKYNKDFDYEKEKEFYIKTMILTDNLYGVDLDEKAVEIAKLNLLVNTLSKHSKLPNLAKNIKNGNSLISGTDAELKKYFGKDYRDKKPFNWEEEFPEVFNRDNPGFDVVIGNPPYIFARSGSFNESEKKYYYDHFKLQQYQINTFSLFIELSYNLLRGSGGFGFIVPNNWLTINSFSGLRKFLLQNTGNLHILNSIDSVFGQASVDTCVLTFQKSKPTNVSLGEFRGGQLEFLNGHQLDEFLTDHFVLHIKSTTSETLSLKNCVSLGKIAKVSTGIKAYQVGKGKPVQNQEIKDNRKYHSKEMVGKTYKPYLKGVDVKRYELCWSGEYISYGDWLAEPRKSVPFDTERILVRQIPSPYPNCINAVFTTGAFVNDINSMVIFSPKADYDLKYILGVINSRLLSYWFVQTFDKFQRKIFPQFKVNELAQFPIYPASRSDQKTMIALVDKILDLKKQITSKDKGSNKWDSIQSEIKKTDYQIDELVYKLYGLTPEEIKIMETA